jgi:hypothetical protein
MALAGRTVLEGMAGQWVFEISLNLFIIKVMRQPGFEPGSIAWKATILTTRLLAHS